MTFQYFMTVYNYGWFGDYSTLLGIAFELIPFLPPAVGIIMIMHIVQFRLNIKDKQKFAKDEGKISSDDKPRYISQSSNNSTVTSDTTVASSNTTVSPSNSSVSPSSTSVPLSDTGGNNTEQDYSSILQQYIDDLQEALTKGDQMLSVKHLGWLAENSRLPTEQEAAQFLIEFLHNLNNFNIF